MTKYLCVMFDGTRISVGSNKFANQTEAWDAFQEQDPNESGFILTQTSAKKLINDLQAELDKS